MKAQKEKIHMIKIDSKAYAMLNAYQNKLVQETGMKATYSQLIYAVFELYMKEHKKGE